MTTEAADLYDTIPYSCSECFRPNATSNATSETRVMYPCRRTEGSIYVDSNGDGVAGRVSSATDGSPYDEQMFSAGICIHSNMSSMSAQQRLDSAGDSAPTDHFPLIPNIWPFTLTVEKRGYALIDGTFDVRVEADTDATVIVTARVLRTKHEVSKIYNFDRQSQATYYRKSYHLEVLPQGGIRDILLVYTIRKKHKNASASTWRVFVPDAPTSECTVQKLTDYADGTFFAPCFPQTADINERTYLDFDYRIVDNKVTIFRLTKVPALTPTVTTTYNEDNIRNALWGVFSVTLTVFVFSWMVESTRTRSKTDYISVPSTDPLESALRNAIRVKGREGREGQCGGVEPMY